MTITFDLSVISKAIDKALEKALRDALGNALVCDEEFYKRIRALFDDDKTTYYKMVEDHFANLNHDQSNDFRITFDRKKKEEIRAKAVENLIKVTSFLDRRQRHSNRIDQGDFKSTTFAACMPIPPIMMKGGLYHTAKVEV